MSMMIRLYFYNFNVCFEYMSSIHISSLPSDNGVWVFNQMAVKMGAQYWLFTGAPVFNTERCCTGQSIAL